MKRRESAPSRSARMATRCIPRHERQSAHAGRCRARRSVRPLLCLALTTARRSEDFRGERPNPSPNSCGNCPVRGRRVALDPRPPTPADPGPIGTSEGLVQHAEAYTGSARPQRAGTPARVSVSDRGTLGGLTQFVTQFGVSGSAARPQTIDSKDTERCPSG